LNLVCPRPSAVTNKAGHLSVVLVYMAHFYGLALSEAVDPRNPDGNDDSIHQEAELRKEADEEMERKREAIAEEQKKKLEGMLAAQAQEYAAKQQEELAKAQKALEEEMSSAIDEYRTRCCFSLIHPSIHSFIHP
jgi:hypothetical protein